MNLEVDLIAGVIKGGPPPKNLPAPRLIKIFIAGERNDSLKLKKNGLNIVCKKKFEESWTGREDECRARHLTRTIKQQYKFSTNENWQNRKRK